MKLQLALKELKMRINYNFLFEEEDLNKMLFSISEFFELNREDRIEFAEKGEIQWKKLQQSMQEALIP